MLEHLFRRDSKPDIYNEERKKTTFLKSRMPTKQYKRRKARLKLSKRSKSINRRKA